MLQVLIKDSCMLKSYARYCNHNPAMGIYFEVTEINIGRMSDHSASCYSKMTTFQVAQLLLSVERRINQFQRDSSKGKG